MPFHLHILVMVYKLCSSEFYCLVRKFPKCSSDQVKIVKKGIKSEPGKSNSEGIE
jgi:hypothetical protein